MNGHSYAVRRVLCTSPNNHTMCSPRKLLHQQRSHSHLSGNLVLVRTGESSYNREGRYSGWSDCPLTDRGHLSAVVSGLRLLNAGVQFDAAFTSSLSRSIRTCWHVLDQTNCVNIPVHRCWELNERHMGGLQGMNKATAMISYGSDVVDLCLKSMEAMPPRVENETIDLTSGENYQMVISRVSTLWQSQILPLLSLGQRVLVVGHRCSLGALIVEIENSERSALPSLSLPPVEVPMMYSIDAVGHAKTMFRHRKSSRLPLAAPRGLLLADSRAVRRAVHNHKVVR